MCRGKWRWRYQPPVDSARAYWAPLRTVGTLKLPTYICRIPTLSNKNTLHILYTICDGRSCSTNHHTFRNESRDDMSERQYYCINSCSAQSKCGDMVVPESHLQVCIICMKAPLRQAKLNLYEAGICFPVYFKNF